MTIKKRKVTTSELPVPLASPSDISGFELKRFGLSELVALKLRALAVYTLQEHMDWVDQHDDFTSLGRPEIATIDLKESDAIMRALLLHPVVPPDFKANFEDVPDPAPVNRKPLAADAASSLLDRFFTWWNGEKGSI